MKKTSFAILLLVLGAFLVSFTLIGRDRTSLRATLSAYSTRHHATCTGAKTCNACKNCKYCKHCAKDGGSCGVCK